MIGYQGWSCDQSWFSPPHLQKSPVHKTINQIDKNRTIISVHTFNLVVAEWESPSTFLFLVHHGSLGFIKQELRVKTGDI